MQSHIRKVYACLVATCHLRFWQDDRGLLRATAVTRGWNGYRNKSQHRKLTLEKKILPPPQQGFEPATFRSRVRRSNHWATPAPRVCVCKADIKTRTTASDKPKYFWTFNKQKPMLKFIATNLYIFSFKPSLSLPFFFSLSLSLFSCFGISAKILPGCHGHSKMSLQTVILYQNYTTHKSQSPDAVC